MRDVPRLKVVFYKSQNGKEPVRDWLKSLSIQDKKAIGEDIKTVQFGWPLGMPLVRKLESGLWEVRSNTSAGTARVLFTVLQSSWCCCMVLSKNLPKLPWTTYRWHAEDWCKCEVKDERESYWKRL